MQKQKLYAFWDYDVCPYILGGVIIDFTFDGRVRIKGYQGMAFKPMAILPDEVGEEALLKIKELGFEFNDAEKAIKSTYRNKALNVINIDRQER